MKKEIPDLLHAKIIRVDKNNNRLLVWFGEEKLKIYSLKTKEETKTIPLVTANKNWITMGYVKFKMDNIIQKGLYI